MMADNAQSKVRIKWVRSGIGFSYKAKVMIRSLGLRRLNQVVERLDTPQVRGLVAKIPHLVQVVDAAPASAWPAVSEYSVSAPEKRAMAQEPPKPLVEVAQGETTMPVSSERKQPLAAPKPEAEETGKEGVAPPKSAPPKKQARVGGTEKTQSAKATEASKKEKPAAPKRPKSPAKGKK